MLKTDIVFSWVNGSKFLVKQGETGITGNIYGGLNEFEDMSFLLHVLREEDLFVDVGANVGAYSILACAAVGSNGIAFEPAPSAFDRLMGNVRLNDIEDKILCLNEGVGEQPGELSFTLGLDTVNHVVAKGEFHEDSKLVKISTLNEKLKDASPAVIKIDVEGFETPVLDGANRVLENKHLHSLIIELNGSGERYGFDEKKILEKLSYYEFSTYSYDPFCRKLISLGGKNLTSGNTLFIRQKEKVEERLSTSRQYKVLEHLL